MDLSGNSRQGTGKKPYDLPPESARSAPVGPLNRRRMGPDRKKLTVSRAFLLVLLVCAIPISGDIRSENPGIHDVDYPLRTFKFFRRTIIANRDPSVDVDFDSRMIRFSAVVTYLGEYRPLSDSKTEKFKILNTVNVLHEKIWFFNYEVKVRDEEGREFWIPANKVLAQRIDENVEKGADFTVKVTYLGCCYEENERILTLNRADFSVTDRILPQSCFTNELLGIKLKSSFQESYDELEGRYGTPYRRFQNEKRQDVAIFTVDEPSQTALYIRNGGPEYTDRVSSIQLSTYNGGTIEFYKDLSLGATKQEMEEALDLRLGVQKGQYDLLYSVNSPCTFEMDGGKLFSVFISEDPYY